MFILKWLRAVVAWIVGRCALTVSSSTSRMSYTGSSSASVFPYTFKIFDESELVVTVLRVSTGVETTLVITTDYTVSGEDVSSGGNVTLVNASQAWLSAGTLATGYNMTIRRVVPQTQTTAINSNGPFDSAVHEKAFDRGVMRTQQLQDEVNRSMQLPETEAGTSANTTMPDAATRASKAFGFDASGNPTAMTVTSVGAPLTASYVVATAASDLSADRTLTGTANQITVTDNGANSTIVLSTPQSIGTGSSPTFANVTDSGLTSGRVVIAGTAGLLEDDASLLYNKTTNILTAGDALVVSPAAAPGVLANGQRWSDSTQIAPVYRTGGMTEYGTRCVYSQVATVTVSDTVTQTTLFTTPAFGTATLPANYLTVGKIVRVTVSGGFGITGTPTLALTFRINSVDVAALTFTTVATLARWKYEATLRCITTGAGGTFVLLSSWTGGFSNAANPFSLFQNTSGSIDTTIARAIDVTATWGTANAANTIGATGVDIEVCG
jgi:hypothetical protein